MSQRMTCHREVGEEYMRSCAAERLAALSYCQWSMLRFRGVENLNRCQRLRKVRMRALTTSCRVIDMS